MLFWWKQVSCFSRAYMHHPPQTIVDPTLHSTQPFAFHTPIHFIPSKWGALRAYTSSYLDVSQALLNDLLSRDGHTWWRHAAAKLFSKRHFANARVADARAAQKGPRKGLPHYVNDFVAIHAATLDWGTKREGFLKRGLWNLPR